MREVKEIREYQEGLPVKIIGADRLIVRAYNEGGHNYTDVDIIDLLTYLKEYNPEIFNQL